MIRAHCALAILLAGTLVAATGPRIAWVTSGKHATVEVTGLDPAALEGARDWPAEKWREVLATRVQQPNAPPMLGAWKAEAGVLRFTPQFPLTPGVAYRAELNPSRLPGGATGSEKAIASEYRAPAPPKGPATVVSQIYPSTDEVPENLLKFYLHFSAPMSRGHIYDHIHLRDEEGREVELPFLEIDEELWDPAMKRLTLFIDPGRIKREVKPLEEVGPALQAGRRFTLVIDAAWLDAAGQPLAREHTRTFRVTAPDRAPIVPKNWKLSTPAAGSTDPLEVDFAESIDHALALRLLRVVNAKGEPIHGNAVLGPAERTWSFKPEKAWSAGTCTLVIPAILEDLAGNNIGKAFEVELLERGERAEVTPPARLTFDLK